MKKLIDTIILGDTLLTLKTLPDESVDMIITSPPYYGLRDYGVEGQLGLEKSLEEFIQNMLEITQELHRVLKKTGTLWWNHGDSYAGSGKGYGDKEADPKFKSILRGGGTARSRTLKPERSDIPAKSLMLQAHRLVIRMIDEQGWILRNQIIWHKPNAMPSSVQDRFGVDYEPIFFFSKSKKYFFEKQLEPFQSSPENRWGGKYFNLRVPDAEKNKSHQYKAGFKEKAQYHAVLRDKRGMWPTKEGRNKRSVWKIPSKGFKDAHFATFPEALIETPIKAGCPRGGVVLDPFFGSGTTGLVARKLGRHYIGIELSEEYVKIAKDRLKELPPLFAEKKLLENNLIPRE